MKKKKKQTESPYIRDGIYDPEEVLSFIGKHEKEYNGHMVKMGSQRYRLFKHKGMKCVECGIEGEFFALEKNKYQETNRYHFNLYAINSENKEVLMTKDHINPVANGGKNKFNNYQTMCTHCNAEKADRIENE